MSLKDSIRNCKDIAEVPFTSTKWKAENGGFLKFIIRELDLGTRMDIYETVSGPFAQHNDSKRIAARVVIHSVYDPATGERVFSDNEEDIALILSKSSGAIEEISEAAMKINASVKGSQDDAKNESSATQS